jgi:hypothetical protein
LRRCDIVPFEIVTAKRLGLEVGHER